MNEESNQDNIGQDTPKNNLGSEAWGVAKLFLIALAIVMPLRYYVAQPFIVRGSSMEPNFSDREYLVIDELTYRFSEPKRGEVIVLRYPNNPQEYFIKRIIGLPGEMVEIKNGLVKIKNKENPAGFTPGQDYLGSLSQETYPDVASNLGEDEYFVMGDNRPVSSDSRIWGGLHKDLIVGRALFRVLPLYKFGLIPTARASQ